MGRKKVNPPNENINMLFPPAEKQKLQQYAEAHNRTMTGLARWIVSEWLAKQEQLEQKVIEAKSLEAAKEKK